MARRPQPHILYLAADRRSGPWVRGGIWQDLATAERQAGRYRYTPGAGWIALPVQAGESWPQSFASADELDAHYLQAARQRRRERSA